MLKGKVAIVTGGGRGIGAAIALKLASMGADIAVLDYAGEEACADILRRLTQECGATARAYRCDVSSFEDAKAAVAAVKKDFGTAHILVNNAGYGVFKTIDQLTEEDFMKTFKIDELGVFLGTKYVSESMKKAGYGSIINISSVDGLVSAATAIAYSASKHAVTGMTKGAAVELGPYHIRCNSIHPGIIKSPMADQDDVVEYLKQLEQDIPLRRRAEVGEVTEVVIFLASDVSSYVNGTQIVVDGGLICDL